MIVYAFVPAKGTSSRIENKNMQFLDGERLYINALKKLLQCKQIDKVFLDTESAAMYSMADYLPVEFMQRDPKFASNATDGHQLFLNEIETNPDADIYVQLLCTSPFIDPETIDRAIQALKDKSEYDSAILMQRDKYYLWKDGTPTYDINHIPNSVDLAYTEIETMGLYICRKEVAVNLKRRYGNKPLMLYAKPEEAIDVNTPVDLEFAKVYAAGLRRQDNKKLNLIKHFVSSPALSDLLDDMSIELGESCGSVINGWRSNIAGSKMLGRANTLRLRSLLPDEDFRGIYDALDSYEGIAENDIIVVENECAEYAYFGDLNARLAIRAGACGAVIDGMTRDRKQTELLGIPVFSRGYNATDVRRRAVLDYINKPIKIAGYTVTPGDLIFADENALVVIYQKHETEVLQRCLEALIKETKITKDIFEQTDVHDIVSMHGAF